MNSIVRTIVGVVIELVAWFALGTIGFIAIGLQWPEFAAANRAFTSDVLCVHVVVTPDGGRHVYLIGLFPDLFR